MLCIAIFFCIVMLIPPTVNAEGSRLQLGGLIYNPSLTVYIDGKALDPEDPNKHSHINYPMLVSFDSSITFLAKTCQDFDTSRFKDLKVTPETNDKPEDAVSISYDGLKVNGFKAEAKVNLFEYWETNSVIVSNSCENNDLPRFTEKSRGMIGLGYKGDAVNNFKGEHKTFAFYIEKLPKDFAGYLLFSPNNPEAELGKPIQTLKTNEDWRIPGEAKITIKDTTLNFGKVTLIHDMKYKVIGVSQAMYQHVWEQLTPLGLSYDQSWKRFYFQGNWSALPNIILTVGDQEIIITPDQYIPFPDYATFPRKVHNEKTEVLFNINKGRNDDTLILGMRYLYNFYTVFDTTKGQITSYATKEYKNIMEKEERRLGDEAKERERVEREKDEAARRKAEEDKRKEEEEKRNRMLIWGGGIFLLVIVVIVVGYFIWRNMHAKKLVANDNPSDSYAQFMHETPATNA